MLFSSTGCSQIARHHKGIDPELVPYLKDYRNLIDNPYQYNDRFETLSAGFRDLDGPIGVCYWLIGNRREISFDPHYWRLMDPISRQLTVYHELEHCIRFRMHSSKKWIITNPWELIERIGQDLGIYELKNNFIDGCPSSVMYPYEISNSCVAVHYLDYIEEIIKH